MRSFLRSWLILLVICEILFERAMKEDEGGREDCRDGVAGLGSEWEDDCGRGSEVPEDAKLVAAVGIVKCGLLKLIC